MAKFVPRQRKRRVLDRQRAASAQPAQNDSNTTELIPISKSAREERRQQLKEDLKAQQPENKISRKKQKRLDKYIDLKLKKDKNVELLRKLAESKVDTSLFRSLRELGQGGESKRQVFERAVKERERGINLREAEKILFQQTQNGDDETESDSEVEIPVIPEKADPTPKEQVKSLKNSRIEESAPSPTEDSPLNGQRNGSKAPPEESVQPPIINTSFGSGLKRPLEIDESGFPVLPKRVKKNGNALKFTILSQPTAQLGSHQEEESDWEGFSDISDDDSELSGTSDKESNESRDNDNEEDDEASEEQFTEESEEESEEDEDPDAGKQVAKQKSKARMSAFKAWAEQQRNEAIGFKPSNHISDTLAIQSKLDYTPRPIEQEPLPSELTIQSNVQREAYAIKVERSNDVQEARLRLPVVAKEQEIMEAIFSNDTVIISGTTGSGKTTQVPQFLFENGFGDPKGPAPGMIGITQPRRVAAVSMAKRVGDELGISKDRVAYQIRFDTTVSNRTAVKFMTDGVLLREMAHDFALRKYSAIVIDEAHERTVNTDILISLMSRCVKARAELAKDKPSMYTPLKLIIMSATLRVSDFRENQKLFNSPPPLVQAEGRQFEVVPHWARRTTHDFLEDAFRKICRGHRQLPPGGMLVFLTGQTDIKLVTRRLEAVFKATEPANDLNLQVRIDASDMMVEEEDLHFMDSSHQAPIDEESDDESDIEFEGLDEKDPEFKIENEEPGELLRVHVVPLYSQLPSKAQLKVFEPVPDGSRLIVLATNVAETSLTIPGIRYVIDSGRVKERTWDNAGVQTFQTTWISKASANQRMGRAGRTGPGHCYRLYSSAVYETFKDFAEPEIYRSPLEGVVLQLKALNIARIDNFPFPTPPDRANLVKAESLLCHLGALDSSRRITQLGRELHKYPLNPRFAQMLRLGLIHGIVDHTIAIVAALDVPEIFIPDNQLDLKPIELSDDQVWTNANDEAEIHRAERAKAVKTAHYKLSRLSPTSDGMKLLAALVSYTQADDPEGMCDMYFLRSKALKEANQLREQLNGIVTNANANNGKVPFTSALSDPSDKEGSLLRQIISAGFVDQVAIRADLLPNLPAVERKPKRAIDVRYKTLMSSYDPSSIQNEDEKFVFLHPSSILATKSPTKLPSYIIYHRLQKSQSSRPGSKPKTRMFPLTPVTAEQLAVLSRGTDLAEVSKPRGKIAVIQSNDGKERRQCHVDLSLVGRKGELGWTLVRKDVVQRREPGEGWVVEKFVG